MSGFYAFFTKVALALAGVITVAGTSAVAIIGFGGTAPAATATTTTVVSTPAPSTTTTTSPGLTLTALPESVPGDEDWCPKKKVVAYNYVWRVNGTVTAINRYNPPGSGLVPQGATVSVSFSIPNGCAPRQYGLAAYTAPEPYYDPDTAHGQVLHSYDGGFFGPGRHTLTVTIPDCYYQMDFFAGPVLIGTTPFYGGAYDAPPFTGRLISAVNDGDCPCGATEIYTNPTVPTTPNPTQSITGLMPS